MGKSGVSNTIFMPKKLSPVKLSEYILKPRRNRPEGLSVLSADIPGGFKPGFGLGC